MRDNKCVRVLLGLAFCTWIASLRAEERPEATATIHYQPAGGIFGDTIPFYHDGVHHVFYLRSGNWYHLVSHDLVRWNDLGPAIVADENDSSIATGSIVENDGVFHAFYTTASRTDHGPGLPSVRVATSRDLTKWTVQKTPLLTTREIVASECPDIFPLGDGWAMVYYTDTTRVRLADDPSGPWRCPRNDAPWGLHFQAGKTEFDGQRRIIHAYLQRADSDYAEHVYGGCMALPRELYLDEQGRLATRLIPEIVAACQDDATEGKRAVAFTPEQVDCVTLSRDRMTLAAKTGTAALAVWKDAPADFFLSADVTLAPGATLSLLLCARMQLPKGALALLARDGRVSVDNLRITRLPLAKTP